MNQLAKKNPTRAKDVGAAGAALGRSIETSLDISTRVLTGGRVGAADLFNNRGNLGERDTRGGGNGGRGEDGRDGRGGAGGRGVTPGDLGGNLGTAATPRAGGRGQTAPPAGNFGGPKNGLYGGYYGGYYGGGFRNFSLGFYGFCSPFARRNFPCYPWFGWGLGRCWSYYWYDLGFNYRWYYPRTSFISLPLYQVTTQVVYDTLEPAPQEEIVYIDEPIEGGGVAIPRDELATELGEPHDPNSLTAQQALTRASEYYLQLGDRSFRDGQYGDAVHFYAKAVEFGEEQGVLYLVLADALFATGDYHYAAFAIRKALELDSTLVSGEVDKRTFYTDPSEFDHQLQLLERYVEDHFLDQDARLVLIVNYLFAGRPEAARALLSDDFSQEIAASPAGQALEARLAQ